MNFNEAVTRAQTSTRIVIFAPQLFSDCLLHCLDFHQIQFGFHSDQFQKELRTDFQIFQTENWKDFNDIKPNIALIIVENAAHQSALNLNAIINGGVLIYNKSLEEFVSSGSGFYRKLSFENTTVKYEGAQVYLETDFNHIPVQTNNNLLLQNILGLKMICQQMGLMEEDFYEALMEYN